MNLLSAALLAVSIIPQPAKLEMKEGQFTLTPATAIWTTTRTSSLGRQLERYLEPATGFDLAIRTGVPAGNRIVLKIDPTLDRLGDEGYVLDVARGAVIIRAPKEAGIFYGIAEGELHCCADFFREVVRHGVDACGHSAEVGAEWEAAGGE